MFIFQSPSKYSSFDTTHLPNLFSSVQKQFSNSSISMPFSAYQVNRERGACGCAIFSEKLLNTQRSLDRCAHKSPIRKWAND